MNNNEDIILLGLRAKDETEDFINRHLENPSKGWPKLQLYSFDYNEQRHDENRGKQKSN